TSSVHWVARYCTFCSSSMLWKCFVVTIGILLSIRFLPHTVQKPLIASVRCQHTRFWMVCQYGNLIFVSDVQYLPVLFGLIAKNHRGSGRSFPPGVYKNAVHSHYCLQI